MKLLILALTILASIALSSALPSDLIQTGPKPGQMSLSGTIPDSAKAIDALNEGLSKQVYWEMPDFGHYASYTVEEIDNGSISTTASQTAFISTNTGNESLSSVGNATGNFTIINETVVWL